MKNAESMDIIIMVLGYLSMHLTFVSLFLSMRRLGSNFWLAATVLFSSVFAFLFGLTVTLKLGVPINMILLSEGLPFLVIIIGFEKPIVLTRAVLSASLDARKTAAESGESVQSTTGQAVGRAVRESGFEILRDYCLEILILIAGAASGIQGGLRPFCFLAAWILVFDCALLFTFYMSILTVKLEINRIKRHVDVRKALEEDGVSRQVAEKVALSNEWPNPLKGHGKTAFAGESTLFGRKIKDSSIPKFKVMMVSGFILVNLVNLLAIPFRSASRSNGSSSILTLSTQSPLDPFKVAGKGLDVIFKDLVSRRVAGTVTVLSPIKYDLAYPSIHYSVPQRASAPHADLDYGDQIFGAMGSRVMEGVLKSFEDPVLSKWIIAALAMSVVLNGYLFNAARWGIKDPTHPTANPSLGPMRSSDVQANETSRRSEAPTIRPTRSDSTDANDDDDDEGLRMKPSTVRHTDRTFEGCVALVKEKRAHELDDAQLIELSLSGKIPGYALEKSLGDMTRAVKIRRAVVSRTAATRNTSSLLENSKLPYRHFDYERVFGACCENVVGYLPLPLGLAGPLTIDGQNYFVPMATTEGVLVASTSRGAKAINAGGGAVTCLTGDGMTRGPCVSFDSLTRAGAAKIWLDSDEGQRVMKSAFNSTSRFARLQAMRTALAGTYLYIRFKTTTGDAMGMNMISKGVEHALKVMQTEAGFDDMAIISLSGNYCTDKKPAAINWIDGRGKSVVAEAIIPGDVVRSVLKSDVNALVELNISKNLVGSAMAGSVGGFNAHAANIVTAIFLATGQDAAQNVESSNCITLMKK